MPAPAVGWPLFIALGIAYFAMAYLLIGALFLTIGSMATTVREVQTLSMPATMLQLIVFFFLAAYAVAAAGQHRRNRRRLSFPFSSPLRDARAGGAGSARCGRMPRRIAWQALCVGLFDQARRGTVPQAGDEVRPGTAPKRKKRKAAAGTDIAIGELIPIFGG